MVLCDSCQSITFNPVNEDSLDGFEAVIHPNLASLKRSANLRKCNLCVALHGIIQHQDLVNPGRVEKRLSDRLDIALGIHYKEESSDDWVFVDDEIGRDDGDAPKYLTLTHARFSHAIRIYNPEAISRSSWSLEREDVAVSADELGATNAALEVTSHNISTGSPAALALMRSWIRKCQNDHEVCGKKPLESVSNYPTRLLDVSRAEDESGVVFLVSLAESIQQCKRPRYATLSHRWKPGHSCITTSSTERKYAQEGIPTELLLRTFREACITAKNLGLRYLWIDSLCILQQGDDAGKAREILRMADYYQNADLNITAATEHNEGLWQKRDGEAIQPFIMPIKINTPNLRRKTQRVILRVAPCLQGVKSHLDNRAWILQERIFASRTIFFDPYWVSFQCAEMSASESCPEGVRTDRNTNSTKLENDMGTEVSRDVNLSIMGGVLRDLSSEVASGEVLGDTARNAILGLWFDILEQYSLRQLSFESDRLIAISSLAERVSRILQDEYIGGIWKNNLLTCLQWSHTWEDGYLKSTRRDACRAPTWSWASVNHKPESPCGFSVEALSAGDTKPLVRILDLKWSVRGSNMFSDLSEGKLVLSGRVLRGYAYSQRGGPDVWKDMVTMTEELEELPQERITHHPDYGSEDWKSYSATFSESWWLHICGKKSGQRARIILRIIPDARDCMVEGFFYLLPLADYPIPDEATIRTRQVGRLFGLILEELKDGTFQRVGCSQVSAKYLMTVKERSLVLI